MSFVPTLAASKAMSSPVTIKSPFWSGEASGLVPRTPESIERMTWPVQPPPIRIGRETCPRLFDVVQTCRLGISTAYVLAPAHTGNEAHEEKSRINVP